MTSRPDFRTSPSRGLASLLVCVLALSGCGSTPASIALAEGPDSGAAAAPVDPPEPELVSAPAEVVPTTTTVVAADTRTDFCEAGSDFPVFDGPIDSVSADMDADGELDRIFLLADSNGISYDAWIAVSFASGGIATGVFDGFAEPVVAPSLDVVDLTNGLDGVPEILFVASSGPAISQTAVMSVVDCEVVTTTLFDDPFLFDSGATAGYASSAGCAYGTGGRLEFTVTDQNPSVGDWSTTVYTLDGSTWTQVDRYAKRDFPDLEEPVVLSMADCTGLILGD